MSIYSKMDVDFVVATDASYKNLVWSRENDALNQVIRTDQTVHSAGVASIAPSGSFVVPMGDVGTGTMLLIRADQEITAVFNGGAEEITVKPIGAYPGLLALNGELTALTLANQSATSSATVEYCVVGVEA